MVKTYEKRKRERYYLQAKVAGYRSRAAYKLIQLNRKYNFLQSARVCIDLCAAPGSWMQVATRFMPVSSVIIGVDRYRIISIPNTIALQGDITTEKVRQDLRANLKTWKADVVLHDGAPHVGQSWLYDAYQQNLLVLHAFKLACEFLRKDGTFVTKIFRSRDHLSLQYVFKKLFKKVEATKPIASRIESAEMFVVCVGFLAPDKVDPEFFDPQHVFQSLEAEPRNKINVLKPEKSKRKAEGYQEGITMLFEKKKISEFINSPDYIDLLEVANEFEWDLPAAFESAHTTSEIIEICKDIKVLGRKDLRTLINWRKAVQEEIKENEEEENLLQDVQTEEVKEDQDEVDEDAELKLVQEQIDILKADKQREDKKRQKKLEKKRKKLQEKMSLCLMVPGDPGPQETQMNDLFTLETLNRVEKIDDVVDKNADDVADSESDIEGSHNSELLDSAETYKVPGYSDPEESDDDLSSDDEGLRMDKEEAKEKKKKRVTFADEGSTSDSEPDDDTAATNPLLTDLVGDNVAEKRERKAESWFSRDVFEGMEDEEMEDFDLQSAIQKHEKSGGIVIKKNDRTDSQGGGKADDARKIESSDTFNVQDGPDSDSDSDSGVDADVPKEGQQPEQEGESKKKKKRPVLDAVGLALATKMIHSKKARRDMYDDGWNKYMWGEEDLPKWFADDEKRFNKPSIKVDQNDLLMYLERDKAVDARTIKKVVEAKARKKRRSKNRFKKLRKLADVVLRNPDVTPREKAIEIKKIYKKAFSSNKREKKYVVMKKSYEGKCPRTKGPVKLVDKRMKKDKRAAEKQRKNMPKSLIKRKLRVRKVKKKKSALKE